MPENPASGGWRCETRVTPRLLRSGGSLRGRRRGRRRRDRGDGLGLCRRAVDAHRLVHVAPERDDDDEEKGAEPKACEKTQVPSGLLRIAHPLLVDAEGLFLVARPARERRRRIREPTTGLQVVIHTVEVGHDPRISIIQNKINPRAFARTMLTLAFALTLGVVDTG